MILPSPKDALHKAWLYRVLMAMYDNLTIAGAFAFKGGTCAAMLGWLDRFSVDLDFDFIGKQSDMNTIRAQMEIVFDELGLTIKDASKNAPQYFLRYPAKPDERNTLKIDVTLPPPKANTYVSFRLQEIDRVLLCQTKETMMANKLVALMDRHKKTRAIAGRDLYDIHHFFLQGFRYNEEVIRERTGKDPFPFFKELCAFIDVHITETILAQDLNVLLPPEHFQRIRKTLKSETLMFLEDELQRLQGDV